MSTYNDLSKRTPRKLKFEDREIDTILSDTEAISICGGITNGQAKQVWKRYQQNKETQADRFAAHIYAMNSVKEFGYEVISRILELPTLPIGIGNPIKVFRIIDKLKMIKQHPCFHLLDTTGIAYTLSFSYSTSIEISYTNHEMKMKNFSSQWSTPHQKTIRTYDYSHLVLKSEEISIAKVFRDGKVCPINDATISTPILELLIRLFDNPQEEFIYYGTKMGRCSNCNKHIYKSRSIAIAVGPVCAKYLGFNW